MIAKLVSFSPIGREAGIAKARKALSQYKIFGLNSNVEFLKRCFENESFAKGDFDSNFIPENLESLLAEEPIASEEVAAGVAAYCFLDVLELNPEMMEETGPWDKGDTYRVGYSEPRHYEFIVEAEEQTDTVKVEVLNRGESNTYDLKIEREAGEKVEYKNVMVMGMSGGVVVEVDGRVDRCIVRRAKTCRLTKKERHWRSRENARSESRELTNTRI